MAKKKLVGYICGTDVLEISLGATDIIIYPSITELKKKSKCWKECGIVEIKLYNLKTKVKGTLCL
jgi:hypothetical protein